jgi:hypothetical protein
MGAGVRAGEALGADVTGRASTVAVASERGCAVEHATSKPVAMMIVARAMRRGKATL